MEAPWKRHRSPLTPLQLFGLAARASCAPERGARHPHLCSRCRGCRPRHGSPIKQCARRAVRPAAARRRRHPPQPPRSEQPLWERSGGRRRARRGRAASVGGWSCCWPASTRAGGLCTALCWAWRGEPEPARREREPSRREPARAGASRRGATTTRGGCPSRAPGAALRNLVRAARAATGKQGAGARAAAARPAAARAVQPVLLSGGVAQRRAAEQGLGLQLLGLQLLEQCSQCC